MTIRVLMLVVGGMLAGVISGCASTMSAEPDRSSTSKHTRALAGNTAPRQRRGRNGLIGVSASASVPSGRIGPRTEKL